MPKKFKLKLYAKVVPKTELNQLICRSTTPVSLEVLKNSSIRRLCFHEIVG